MHYVSVWLLQSWFTCLPSVHVLVCITSYIFVAGEFFFWLTYDAPVHGKPLGHKLVGSPTTIDRQIKIMAGGLMFNATCLFIRYMNSSGTISVTDICHAVRCFKRLGWRMNGWSGRIVSTQPYFSVCSSTSYILTKSWSSVRCTWWCHGHACDMDN